MKRKGPPYEVEFGAEGQQPPAYVRIIQKDRIILGGAIEKLSLKVEIAFTPKGAVESNPELINLMLELNETGVVFGYDPRSMVSPSWFMSNLQDQGLLQSPYKEISWRNPKSWLLTTYEVA